MTPPNVHTIKKNEGFLGFLLSRYKPLSLTFLGFSPGMDGFTALKALRAYREIRSLPVVAVSANAMKEDIDHGLEAGFDSYITKPINIARFMEVVDRLLEQKKWASLNYSS